MITAELFAQTKPNNRHWYAYDVLLDGETIVSSSRDPEHDLARALLSRGIKGLVEVMDGKTGKPRSRVNIEKAAKWSVGSNLERYKCKPPKASDRSPHTGESTLPGRDVPPTGSRRPPQLVFHKRIIPQWMPVQALGARRHDDPAALQPLSG